LIPVVQELEKRGWLTKRWQTRKGHFRGGQTFTKSSLHHLLTNPVYLGKIKYKKEVHPGEHQAIVDPDVWQQVQDLFCEKGPGTTARSESHALLKGVLRCRPCGFAMTPAFASKNGGKRYRLYACVNALKRGRHVCPCRYVPALAIERVVVEQVREFAKNQQVSSGANDPLAQFQDHSVWDSLPAAEQARQVQRLVQRVEYDGRERKVAITFHAPGNRNSNGDRTCREKEIDQ
jgi:site-specific DNA recombinase